MLKTIKIINPAPVKRKRRKRVKTNKSHRKVKNVAAKKTVRRKKRNVSRSRKHSNPTVVYTKNARRRRKHSNPMKKYRKRRNPDLSNAGLNITNIMTMTAGAAVGGVSATWITNTFNIEGNMKYIAQLGIAVGGWWLLKKILPAAAVPFAAGVVGAAALEFARDKELLMGLGNSNFTPEDIANLNQFENQYAALNQGPVNGTILPEGMNGTIPLVQGVNFEDSGEYAAEYGS